MGGALGLLDLLKFADKVKNGVKVRKCKIDGTPVEAKGEIKGDLTGVVAITVDYNDGTAKKLEATHSVKDKNTIKITAGTSNPTISDPDIDIGSPIVHILSVDLKVVLDYKENGTPHEMELYGRLVG